MKRQALLVLGMHRSGTSALAGMLVRLGAEGPRTLMPPNESNPLGYWESEPIAEFNDRLLAAADTSWDAWTPIDPAWEASAAATALAAELIRLVDLEFGKAPLLVLKDPRVCRVAPFWCRQLEASGIDVSVVLVVRAPGDVAGSLAARDGFAEEFSLLLWLRHILDAEASTRSLPRAIVSYEELLSDWRVVADRLARQLSMVWPLNPDVVGGSVSAFLRPQLRHHAATPAVVNVAPALGDWLARVRHALHLLSESAGGAGDAHAILDDVRAQVDEASSVFGRGEELLRRRLRRQLTEGQVEQEALRAHTVALESDRGQLRRHADAVEAERAGLQAHVATLESDAASSRAQVRGVQARVHDLEQDLAALRARADVVQESLDRVTSDLAAARHHVRALLASWSWRVTAPLRALVDVASRAIGRKD